MNFKDTILQLAERIEKQMDALTTKGCTKTFSLPSKR